MQTSNEGVDIGVDTAAAHRRSTTKQKQRVNSTKKRASRAGYLARRNDKARRIARTGVHTAQIYGHTAVGMAPTTVNKCKSNVAEATGLMGAGACATTAIKWTFRKGRFVSSSADPRVTIPLQKIRSWMSLWGRSNPHTKRRLKKSWHKLYRKLAQSKARWQCARGTASATICTLLDLGWKPIQPEKWITPSGTDIASFDATA